ncbi:hypothetical protein HY971_03310, partial [Candidatus Kaiserbacteria bacterium]|nr:hypothetical protein [Candidatus Kaiserbacteria bacterium]
LQAVPALVRGGETVRIYWNTVNARTCTILGSNGDGAEGSPTGVWNTAFSGASGKTTSPISSQTTYTLLCHAFAGVIPPIVRESAIVNIIPSFQEL